MKPLFILALIMMCSCRSTKHMVSANPEITAVPDPISDEVYENYNLEAEPFEADYALILAEAVEIESDVVTMVESSMANMSELTEFDVHNMKVMELGKMMDSIAYDEAYDGFKIKIRSNFYSFQAIENYSSANFLKLYDKPALTAKAFNPILSQIRFHIEKIKSVLKAIEDGYGNYEFVKQVNFIDAKTSFESFVFQWSRDITKPCRFSDVCTENKDILSNLNPLIKECITNLETILKL
ncbi:hypothetical protein [Flagellimonas eckloniae]|uniref:Lipoprotein n=1 Tax=Flagellimonas eckloniae TaxID=346185 RepID=A0A0Q1CH23_9FLAO|nr:hypothetical protein [Allomuricauda eckloniae]KQC30228.1 hypothetical protein AAY42_10340 [Allomuricauda eckloniae]